MSDANKKILTRFQNSWFLKRFGDTVRDPTECNLVVVSQQLKVCIARFECISSSLSNCFDLLILTVVLLEFKYKCTEWSNDELWCQRRIISRWVSSPRSVTGQVFATVSAMDTISTSASSSECIMLISKAGNWIPAFKKSCLLCLCRRMSAFFTVKGLWRDRKTFLPSLPLLRLICLLPFGQGTR